jgi:hypothetical protein
MTFLGFLPELDADRAKVELTANGSVAVANPKVLRKSLRLVVL